MSSAPAPAHETKHIRSLTYPHLGRTFHLTQSDDGHGNGTALWLGAQILSAYMTCYKPRHARTRPRVVELGSGVGLTALVLGALGYDVLATDTWHVCESVLRHNVAANLPHLPTSAGSVQVRELDWTVDSDRWRWDDPMHITGGDACGTRTEDLLGPPFDIIVSSDTLYDVSLVDPFFRTVRALCCETEPTLLILALERRDPELVERALASAPMPLTRVPMQKVRKALARVGIRWDPSDWAGVEIWHSR